MALIQANFYSVLLKRTVMFNLVLPVEQCAGPLRLVILLHDYGESCGSFLSGGDIRSLAEAHGAAVLMPNDENHFYVDAVRRGDPFSRHIGKEVPDFCRSLFPLSSRREDTVIAGLRVGGYGALRIGMEYAASIGHIVAADPALVLEELPQKTAKRDRYGLTRRDYAAIFGRLESASGGRNDPLYHAARILEQQRPAPGILLAGGGDSCGAFAAKLAQMGIRPRREAGTVRSRQDFLLLLDRELARLGWKLPVSS